MPIEWLCCVVRTYRCEPLTFDSTAMTGRIKNKEFFYNSAIQIWEMNRKNLPRILLKLLNPEETKVAGCRILYFVCCLLLVSSNDVSCMPAAVAAVHGASDLSWFSARRCWNFSSQHCNQNHETSLTILFHHLNIMLTTWSILKLLWIVRSFDCWAATLKPV